MPRGKEDAAKPQEEKKKSKKLKGAEEKWKAELEKKEKELEEKNKQLLSIAAEYDNFRKRSQKEKEGIYLDAKVKVLSELLPVIDNLERALQGDQSDGESYHKGVEITFHQTMEVMKKLGVEAYGEVGDKFDPELHSAVMHVEDEEAGEQTIVDVFQKGYRHSESERTLRHAMVKVAN